MNYPPAIIYTVKIGMHTFTLMILLLLTGISEAAIINVPDDHETIQAGIDASEDGDTVLVQPGEYVENINFAGHSIVLGSQFLMDSDEDWIGETILDGDESGSVVTIEGGEAAESQLIGFTIQNGSEYYGSGVDVYYSSAVLSHLILINNNAARYGGGIAVRSSVSSISHCKISNNYAEVYGGGIYTYSSTTVINNCVVTGNGTDINGGGILIGSSISTIQNCIIYDNEGGFCGGIYFNGRGSLKNCTIVNNQLGDARYGVGINREVTVLNCIIGSGYTPIVTINIIENIIIVIIDFGSLILFSFSPSKYIFRIIQP